MARPPGSTMNAIPGSEPGMPQKKGDREPRPAAHKKGGAPGASRDRFRPREKKPPAPVPAVEAVLKAEEPADIASRINALVGLASSGSKKQREAALQAIDAITKESPVSINSAVFARMKGGARASSQGERAAVALREFPDKVSFLRKVYEIANRKAKDRRVSEQEIVQEVSDEVEKLLAARGVGVFSDFSKKTGAHKVNEAALTVTGATVTGVETLTLGAYISIISQTVMQTSIVAGSPAGIMFNAACIGAAVALAPIGEVAKALTILESAARKSFRKGWDARKAEVEGTATEEPKKGKVAQRAKKNTQAGDEPEPEEGTEPQKKRRMGTGLKLAVASAVAAAGAGATHVVTKGPSATVAVAASAAKVGADAAATTTTLVMTQAPNAISTAAAFTAGHEGTKFVEEAREAFKDTEVQLGTIIGERVDGKPGAMPSLVSSYHQELQSFSDTVLQKELSGEKSVATGGSGKGGWGPSTISKSILLEGGYTLPVGTVMKESWSAADARAREQRAAFSYPKLDEKGEPVLMLDAEGRPIPVLGADGTPVMRDGQSVYELERVPVDFLTDASGKQESVSEWVERRYGAFEEKAHDEFAKLAEIIRSENPRGEGIALAEYLADRLMPVNVKLDLLRAFIQSTAGFTVLQEEALQAATKVEFLFKTEFTVPCDGLSESLLASLRSGGAGDAGMSISSPELELDLTKLKELKAPPSLTVEDLTTFKRVTELYTTPGNEVGKGLWLLLVGGAFGQLLWNRESGKRRAKKQGGIMYDQARQMFGKRFEQGDEYRIAQAMGETFETLLSGEKGLFSSSAFRDQLPFTLGKSWLFNDPKFLVFAMRQAGEKSGEMAGADWSKPATWGKLMGRLYLKGALKPFGGAASVPEVRAFAKMRDRYMNRKQLQEEVFGETLPGFVALNWHAMRLAELKRANVGPKEPEFVEASTAFKNTYAEMVFGHLLARVRFANTRIEYYQSAYKDLQKEGKFEDLGVERLQNLPNLSFSFGPNAKPLTQDDIQNLGEVRKAGFRALAIAHIRDALDAERKTLAEVDGLIEEFETMQKERLATLTTSFGERLGELKREREKGAGAVQKRGDSDILQDMSARGGLDRINREQLENDIRQSVLDERRTVREVKTEYPVAKQYEAINKILTKVMSAAPGQPLSLFTNDARLKKFRLKVAPVLRGVGYTPDTIAEYYALEFVVTEKGKSDPVFEGELPVETLFAKELAPEDAARQVMQWVEEKRNEASMSGKLYSLTGDITALRKEVTVPASINLSAGDAPSRLETLFRKTVPERRVQEGLEAAIRTVKDIERAGELDDVTKIRRRKETAEVRAKKLAEVRAEYGNLFSRFEAVAKKVDELKKEQKELPPAYPEEEVRATSLAAFLRAPENRAFLSRANITFEYLPSEVASNKDVRLTPGRSILAWFGGRSAEVRMNDVLRVLQDPALKNDKEKRLALQKFVRANNTKK